MRCHYGDHGLFRKRNGVIGHRGPLACWWHDSAHAADGLTRGFAVMHDPAPGDRHGIFHTFRTQVMKYAGRRAPVRATLNNAFAFGGQNAVIAARAYTGEGVA